MRNYIKLGVLLLALLLPTAGWGATYSYRANGTAADKASAAGSNCAACASDPSTCMGPTVYAGETFEDGDVIVRCHIPTGIPGKIWSEGFVNASQTISIPAAPTSYYLLLETGDKLLLESGDGLLLE